MRLASVPVSQNVVDLRMYISNMSAKQDILEPALTYSDKMFLYVLVVVASWFVYLYIREVK